MFSKTSEGNISLRVEENSRAAKCRENLGADGLSVVLDRSESFVYFKPQRESSATDGWLRRVWRITPLGSVRRSDDRQMKFAESIL